MTTNHGGARSGAGRPAKSETKTIAFRVPADMVDDIKKLVKAQIPKRMTTYIVTTTDGDMIIEALNKKQARNYADRIIRGTNEKIVSVRVKPL